MVTDRADASTALPFIRASVRPNSEIQTGESRIYKRLRREYPHSYVTHKNYEFARGQVSTNTVEGAWSHLKLGLRAIYVGVSPKHLDRYVSEFSFRYNSREVTDGERFDIWFNGINGKHLPYKKLIG